MDRLKPCPFCGSKDIKLFGNHRDSFWFRCNKCASIDSYDTERQAVRAWNKRVAIPSADPKTGHWKRRIVDGGYNADWKCSECGYKVYTDFVNYNFCPNCGARMFEPQERSDKE